MNWFSLGKRRRESVLSLLLIFVATMIMIGVASVYSTAVLSVAPQNTIDPAKGPTSTFIVNMTIVNVIDLYGFEFKLFYNSSVLTATSLAVGDFLPDHFIWKEELNNTGGYVWFAVTRAFGATEGVDGNGTLAIVTFSVDAYGESTLEFDPTIHILTDRNGLQIPHEVENGYFRNIEKHDIAMTDVTASPRKINPGGWVSINATIFNEGDAETFDISASYNSTLIETVTGVYLDTRETTTVSFAWDTTGVPEGDYIITANASHVLGETDTIDNTKECEYPVTVAVLDASFEYTPSEPTLYQNVTFDASSSYDPENNITKYEWNFGDGSPTVAETDPIAVHNYTLAGTYTVVLTITDNESLTDTEQKSIVIAKLSSSISIYFDPKTLTIGESTIIHGYLLPARAGANTTIWYRPIGGDTWNTLTTVLTDEDSRYSYDWTPTTAGTFEIKASWPGDVNTESTEEESVLPLTINKLGSTIIIALSSESITMGSMVTINGTISPSRSGVDVTIQYRFSGEDTWNTLTTVLTDEDSRYSYDWTPTTAGTFEIKASWPGDVNTIGDESDIKNVTVAEISSTISIAVSPDSVTYRSSITISGMVSPTRTGVHVTILYRISGGETWDTLAVVITDENGQYSYDWTPTTAGTFEIKASWPGDVNTIGDESDIKNVTVEGEPTTDISLYAVAVIVIIAVAMILFYVFWRTRSKKHSRT